jgi:hypothetical protein
MHDHAVMAMTMHDHAVASGGVGIWHQHDCAGT